MGFQLMWSPAHVRHGRNLVENLKSVNYDVTSLFYAEMIKQTKHYELSCVLQIKQTYTYKIMETSLTQHIC